MPRRVWGDDMSDWRECEFERGVSAQFKANRESLRHERRHMVLKSTLAFIALWVIGIIIGTFLAS